MMVRMVGEVVMAYVPVIHRGYVDFFRRHNGRKSEKFGQTECYVFGDEVIKLVDTQLDYLRKEIRAISPEEASRALTALGIANQVQVLNLKDCQRIGRVGINVVLPDEDTSRVLVKRFFPFHPVTYDPVFLRWHRSNVNVEKPVTPNRLVVVTELDREMTRLAELEAKRSSDWWRQIGAVATLANGQMLFSGCNHHLPSPYTPYVDGDPRNTAHRGEGLDRYTSIHAEAEVIALAASEGVPLAGAYLYTSTFPCPTCAKLIARVGFARLYYAGGYAILDGETTLRQHGVEIIKVEIPFVAPDG